MEQIVHRAGVSRPTSNAYFRDKRSPILMFGEGLWKVLVEGAYPWLIAVNDVGHSLLALLPAYQRFASTVRADLKAATYDGEVAVLWRVIHDGPLPRAEQRILATTPRCPVRRRSLTRTHWPG